jgi:hypothetical protein
VGIVVFYTTIDGMVGGRAGAKGRFTTAASPCPEVLLVAVSRGHGASGFLVTSKNPLDFPAGWNSLLDY